jgi:ABC-type multidrug transport system permease subunit
MNHVLALAVALIVSFAMAMVLTPSGDPISMLLFWAPMLTAFVIFYFIGVLAGRRITGSESPSSGQGTGQRSAADQLGP